ATATTYLALAPASTNQTQPAAPTLGVPSETPTTTGTEDSPGFGTFEAIIVLVIVILFAGMRKRKV
ncbi:MAG TPA: hypothetical protein VHT73_15535, partial [Thermodesulfobacteriota bacterium]|nr:hypothetical protein [Thermodesulfobacteriota bacterium]